MILDVTSVTPQQLDQAAQFFDEQGYVRLTGLQDAVTGAFEEGLAEAIDIPVRELQPLLDSSGCAATPLASNNLAAAGSDAPLIVVANPDNADRPARTCERHVPRAVQGRYDQRRVP